MKYRDTDTQIIHKRMMTMYKVTVAIKG